MGCHNSRSHCIHTLWCFDVSLRRCVRGPRFYTTPETYNSHHTGNQYMTAPAFGSLQPVYKKIAFSFAIPTIIFLGSLYSVRYRSNSLHSVNSFCPQSVSSRFVFFRLFSESKHRHSNTFLGWASWTGIVAVTWVLAFIIAEVIPFFSDMLSLMSSLFDGWFG